MNADAMAVFGARTATGLLDVTNDVAALDSHGFWAVALTYDGKATCARFADVRDAVPAVRPWTGPSRGSWSSSLDASAYLDRVRRGLHQRRLCDQALQW